MIQRGIIILSLLLFLVGTGCRKENLCDCLKGTGDEITEQRALNDFTEIEVHKNILVTLVQDTINYAVVKAGDNLIALIDTKIDGGVLKINNRNTCNWVRSYKKEIVVTVHLRHLNFLNHYGSEDINSSNIIVSDNLDVRNYNSADIHLSVNTKQCFARLMGASGDIYIEGTTDYNYVFGGSFGFAYERELINRDCFVDHRGNGDIYVKTGEKFKVNIKYVGDVYYSGNPEIEMDLAGSGKLIHY